MITSSFSLTATERVLPKLALDFTTGNLDSRITFTRSGNTATYTNSSGVITAINANLPRFDYNPTTLVCNGLLIEESRKNILLNSLIDGTNLSTQSVTSAATSYTLSFYGTGSIVLSGTASSTVTGTGAYPTRKTYTFTPTAGTLTLTVSGTVQYAQLEAGAFATSFIPTDNAAGGITRNADVATMTGTNFSSWFNATQGTFETLSLLSRQATTGGTGVIDVSDGTTNNEITTFYRGSGAMASVVNTSGSTVADLTPSATITANTPVKVAFGYKADNFASAAQGETPVVDVAGALPTVTQMTIGYRTVYLNGWMQKIYYWPQRLTNAEVQAFSK